MKINQEMVSYAKQQLATGVSRVVITENLKNVGWSDEIISETFNFLDTNSSIPINQPLAITTKVESNSINSPYSIFLVAVLVVSLFILTNGIYSDIKNFTTNLNYTLLLEGLFVIPFLLAAFLIHGFLKDEKQRFKILSLPYFIISAWVFIRLLWKVGENIWKANNALGVYVALGMSVIVLTGIIIFIQRYIKD